ncbi:MAG: sialidase family protein [Chthoniobacteraceae bacterium]
MTPSTTNPLTETKALVYKGFPPDHCCCDAIWRRLPGGEQGVFFLTGNTFEPQPGNYVALCRSHDEGNTWGDLEPVARNGDQGVTLSEVTVHEGIITVYLQIHAGRFDHWEVTTTTSTDNGRTWSKPMVFAPVPRRAMIRSLYRTTWGGWLLPFQYYEPTAAGWEASVLEDGSHLSPWNGVLIGKSPTGPWREGQRLQGANAWAEVNVVELRDGRLVMLSRSDGAGVLLRTESADRAETWSPYVPTDIPNPGTKFRLFRIKTGAIVLLHNPNGTTSHPNSKPCAHVNRNPLALWISYDDMATWGYQRIITDFPGQLAYPDGEIDSEERYLHFAFDYNRHDVIYWKVAIPLQQ